VSQIKIITELAMPRIVCPHCHLEYALIYNEESTSIGQVESDYCPRCGNPSRLSVSPGTLSINVSESIGVEDKVGG
jgi:Zn finger protein HypA/HybF involved in hydrogenase expression